MSELLAKSDGTTLTEHLRQVAYAAKRIADVISFDKKTAELGAILHDIGKAHPDFQKLLDNQTNAMNFGIPFRHEIASILFLHLFPKEVWNDLIELVIAHHRSPIVPQNPGKGIVDLVEIEGTKNVFKRHSENWEKWSPLAIDILHSFGIEKKSLSIDDAKDAFNYTLDYCESLPDGWSEQKGLMNIADYMASALNGMVYSQTDKLFKKPDLSNYESEDRKSTLYPLSLINAKSEKNHTLLIAPTGAGKTDYLFRRCNGRVFYTLPFQASINAMYHRVKDFLPEDTDIRLLHATSSLQVDDENKYEEVVMQSLAGAAIKILTPHQLAALICGTKGFEAIALDIRGCDVILDEIHSYSDVSQAMVFEIVKVLLKLDCRIHIGSATMPSKLTKMLLDILGGEDNVLIIKLDDSELKKFERHRVIKHSNDTGITEIISQALANNQKVLVVCNRVETSQKRFDEYRQLFPDVPVLLLHSRFKRRDRAEKEKELIEKYNDRSVNPDACIVVSTQVVEVSLDISFDLMITDAAPIDSLIQRFGRINRKRTLESIEKKIIKDIHIIAPPDDKRDVLPYKKDIVDVSFAQFENEEFLKETSIQDKIDNVYPDIDLKSIKTKIVWDDDVFLLRRLCHLPKAVLIEMLNIDSATAILYSDKEAYENSKAEQRTLLEIPVPRSIKFRNINDYGFSEYGSKPLIVPDELYSIESGLVFKEINNII